VELDEPLATLRQPPLARFGKHPGEIEPTATKSDDYPPAHRREPAMSRQTSNAEAPGSPMPTSPSHRRELKLVPAICCLCGIEDAEPVGVGHDFEYDTSDDTLLAVRCKQCGLIYLNPRPADAELHRIYPDNYHAFAFQESNFGLIYRIRRQLEARRLLRWCRDLPTNARILDVGCGDGFHLALLREFGKTGWMVEGVDTDHRAVAAAAARGLTVHHGRVEAMQLPAGSYHLVLLIMTLEHLADPAAVLRSIAPLLAPGGRVGIITDNTGSPDFAIFGGRHWGGYHFPRHLTLFNRNTLTLLAQRANLTVEQIGTAVSPVNWTYSLRNFIQDWGGKRWRWLSDRLSLHSPVALAIFTLLDWPLAQLGRGAILRASFIRSTSEEGDRSDTGRAVGSSAHG
jgi:2-polyprenyl-3-methyl-5-hydroxy-6-metoxy-1,4-benzoquinol methylase